MNQSDLSKNQNGKPAGRSTIHDVAKLANTSIATVSRVLNQPDYPVSEALRRRVLNAVERLGYAPSLAAQSLRGEKANLIGVVIPSITNPFYQQTIMGIESVVDPLGYHLILHNTEHSYQRERRILDSLFRLRVPGVILSSVDPSEDLVRTLIENGVRFVFLDQRVSIENPSCITFDARRGAQMAVEYLIANGHRRIAFASTPLTRWTRMEVFQGYKDALEHEAIGLDESLIFLTDPDNSDGQENLELVAGQVLAERFSTEKHGATAVLCINDMVAISFIHEISKRSIQVPEDVSVIGFDDIPLAELFNPPLTTIRYASHDTGRLAAVMLMESITENRPFKLRMHLTPQLIVRDSVRPLK